MNEGIIKDRFGEILEDIGYLPEPGLLWERRRRYYRTRFNINLNGTFIPAGYITDLSSIPRYLWSFVSPQEYGLLASIGHDYDYGTEAYGDPYKESRTLWGAITSKARARADEVFYKRLSKENERIAQVFYAAVRAGGWNVWRRHTLETVLTERRKYGYGTTD